MKKSCNKLQTEFHFASCKMVNKTVLCKQNFWQQFTWERQRWRAADLTSLSPAVPWQTWWKAKILDVCKYPCSGSSSQPSPQAQEVLDSYHPGFQVGSQNKEEKAIEMHSV